MSELDRKPDGNEGSNNSEIRSDYSENKATWVEGGCLPPEEASVIIQNFKAEVQAGKIGKDDLQKIIDNARYALKETKSGSMKELFVGVLRAAGVADDEIGK